MVFRYSKWFIILLLFLGPKILLGSNKYCLFIGDSFFSHNDLSQKVSSLWGNMSNDTLIVTNHNKNGSTIESQWQTNSKDLLLLFASRQWDFVILELPILAKPQDSTLIRILHSIDSVLIKSNVYCLTMDFCSQFPEMLCAKDHLGGVNCNEFNNCEMKLSYIRLIGKSILNQKFKNYFEVIPLAHYKEYLWEQFSIKLDSDDKYGHPSEFTQSVIARFILFHLLDKNTTGFIDLGGDNWTENKYEDLFYKSHFYENDH